MPNNLFNFKNKKECALQRYNNTFINNNHRRSENVN